MTWEAENLKRIYRAIGDHNERCRFPALAVVLHPFDFDKLGWVEIRGLPIWTDPAVQPGRFRIHCEGQHGTPKEGEDVQTRDEPLVVA